MEKKIGIVNIPHELKLQYKNIAQHFKGKVWLDREAFDKAGNRLYHHFAAYVFNLNKPQTRKFNRMLKNLT